MGNKTVGALVRVLTMRGQGVTVHHARRDTLNATALCGVAGFKARPVATLANVAGVSRA